MAPELDMRDLPIERGDLVAPRVRLAAPERREVRVEVPGGEELLRGGATGVVQSLLALPGDPELGRPDAEGRDRDRPRELRLLDVEAVVRLHHRVEHPREQGDQPARAD